MTLSVTEFEFTRVLTSPAMPESDEQSPLRRAILAGLLDAGVRGQAVATLWVRSEPWAPLQVLIAGALASSQDSAPATEQRPMLFPLGATGTLVSPAEVKDILAPFSSCVGCTGGFEPLLRDTEEQIAKTEERWSSSPLDDVAGYLAHEAFAWLVLCTPRTDDDVGAELDTLRRDLYRLRQSGRLSEADVLDLERGQAWFRSLYRAGVGGVWDVAVALGTRDESTAIPLASVLCTAAERSVSLYKLRPNAERIFSSLDEAIEKGNTGSGLQSDQLPFRATADLAAALVRPPEAELPGLRVVAPPSFDTTLEVHGDIHARVELGTVLDRFLRPAGALTVGLDTLNRHTFVCGATGGGKSQTTRGLLEALSRRSPSIPWLVIEPAKAEYARMAGRLADVADLDVLVIAPGDPYAPPASMNPLEPASLEPGNPLRTFPLQSHADLVRALFMAAFRADEPFPQVLSRALTECYEAAGWDLITGEPLITWERHSGQGVAGSERRLPRYPPLASLQQKAKQVVEEIGYGDDIKKNVRGFVDVRIGSLRLGTPGRFFEGGHPLDVAALLRRNVVIELEGITNDQDKAFVMGALLIRLYEQLLLEEKERFVAERSPNRLRHITVIEEAHRLLRNVPIDSPSAHSLELFASLLAEVRAYGEGIVVAEQIPSKLISDVIKNTALKIVHRLPAADDRVAVGATMNLSEAQSEYVVTLAPGQAGVFADGMDRPVLAEMRTGEDREDADLATRLPTLIAGQRRSRACGAQCRDGEPCTLRNLRHAERFLQAHPELTFWMEVSFAAHGVGFPAPTLAESRSVEEIRERGAKDPRLVECAIAHAVERGVQARYDGLKSFFDPYSLGEHLGALATSTFLAPIGGRSCSEDRGRWRVGSQRVADIIYWMEEMSRGSETPSLEDLGQRVSERGNDAGSGDVEAQLSYLRSLPLHHLKGDRQRALLVGDLDAPRLVVAAAAIVGPGDPRDQIANASSQVLVWERVNQPEQLLPQLCAPREPT